MYSPQYIISQNNNYYVPRQTPQKEVKDEDLDAEGHEAVWVDDKKNVFKSVT